MRYHDTMSEAQLQETVRQAASLFGWRYYHTHNSLRSPEGFPDVVLCGHGQLIMWEIKNATRSLTGAQKGWVEELLKVEERPMVGVIRPKDLNSVLTLLQKRANL